MNQKEIVDNVVALAMAIAFGDLQSVDRTCHHCKKDQIVFSFAVNKSGLYSLYVECPSCGRRDHHRFGSEPPNFRSELVMDKYQKIEDAIAEVVEAKVARLFPKT